MNNIPEDDFLTPTEFYAQVILTVRNQAPLLSDPRLARCLMSVIDSCHLPLLWGYVVLPDQVRLVVGPLDDDALESVVSQIKDRTEQALLTLIRRADDESLDAVLLYNPVWGGAIYQVWQSGYHRQTFWSEYRLSNAVYELGQAPVEAGLVVQAEDWPYKSLGR